MSGSDTFASGGIRFRIRPKQEDPSVASIVVQPSRAHLTVGAVNQCVDHVRRLGFKCAVTGALATTECQIFADAGFGRDMELHLLSHGLKDITAPRPRTLRRAWKRDWDRVLDIDARAFDDFWRFDRDSLTDALHATPTYRFRVLRSQPVTGFHISGMAGAVGYLQRLAVDPDHHRQGLGTILINDSLLWMKNRGAKIAYVNTQVTNDVALAVYLNHGFSLQTERLTVMAAQLAPSPAGHGEPDTAQHRL